MIYLTHAQRAGLTRYARRRRTSMAQAVREAVDRFLASEGQPLPHARFVGSFAGPDRTPVSERVEELLREHLRHGRGRRSG